MNDALRKGWCPGALRPMAAKDGLLVRLRITGGILPAATAHALADLAARHGNGRFDLSARGNLQMRGVRETSLAALHDGLRSLDLLDRDAAAESVRNVIASPLAGLHGGLDIRPLVRALEARLTEDTTLHALPSKFGFLIDDGNRPLLSAIDADIRFDWCVYEMRFAIGLAGPRGNAIQIGTCDAADVVDHATRIARRAMSWFADDPSARRLRDLVATLGADALAVACGGTLEGPLAAIAGPMSHEIVGQWVFGARRPLYSAPQRCLGIAAPFGRLDATMLRDAAFCAAKTRVKELRLTPWRILLIPGVSDEPFDLPGFITNPKDTRLAVTACVGADGCERGTTSTHEDALHLASHVIGRTDTGVMMHVSGCTKGCAKPSPSCITLVARDGRYDLVRDGRAGDRPSRRGLDLAAACAAVLEPA